MKIVLVVTAVLASALGLRAAEENDPYAKRCYVEHCQRDASGTLWCFNTETECATADACLECAEPVDCSYEEADCEEFRCVDTNGRRVRIMQKEQDVAEPSESWYRPGGLEGEGADGGSFDRQGTYSTNRGWWYDTDAGEFEDPEY